MNHATLLAELRRLLGLGEPLLTVFPKQHPDSQRLQLPANISEEMRWYADEVALGAWEYQDYRQQNSTEYLAWLVKQREVGLLGWRAIGVLR